MHPGGGRILIASAAPAKKHGVEKGACEGGRGVNNPPFAFGVDSSSMESFITE